MPAIATTRSNIAQWPVKGFYVPDGIASVGVGRATYLLTANEGDSRDYDAFSDEARLEDVALDPTLFPDAAYLQAEENLGRFTITTANGDIDGDGEFEDIYGFGPAPSRCGTARSTWSGTPGTTSSRSPRH